MDVARARPPVLRDPGTRRLADRRAL